MATVVLDCLPAWKTGDMGGVLMEGWDCLQVESRLRMRGEQDARAYWPVLRYLERGIREMRERQRKKRKADAEKKRQKTPARTP
jgi:hypothetical protein